MAMYPALRPVYSPSSDSWYGKYYRGGDGYQGRWPRCSLLVDGCFLWDGYHQYAEGTLDYIKYRTKDNHGAVAGGPMHYILLGMGEKWRPLAIFFALAGVLVALLGIGTFTQVNSITESIQNTITISPAITALVLSVFVAIAVLVDSSPFQRFPTTVVPLWLSSIFWGLLQLFLQY